MIWQEIATAINGINGVGDRTALGVRQRWANVNNSAKSKVRENRNGEVKTGGGPSTETPLALTPFELLVIHNVLLNGIKPAAALSHGTEKKHYTNIVSRISHRFFI